jgi:hypothetical protein
MSASPIFYEIDECADWNMERRVGKSWDNQDTVNFERFVLMIVSPHAAKSLFHEVFSTTQ